MPGLKKEDATRKGPKRDRLSRDDWIAAGIETLGREGIDQVRVEWLSRKLGVTKGSFYWHFGDRGELLGELLDWWEQRMVGPVIDRIQTMDGPASERLWALMRLLIVGNGTAVAPGEPGEPVEPVEPAVRAWAYHDAVAAVAVARVDRRRLELFEELFQGLGIFRFEASVRARMAYYHHLGESMVHDGEPPEKRLLSARMRYQILTSSLPPT